MKTINNFPIKFVVASGSIRNIKNLDIKFVGTSCSIRNINNFDKNVIKSHTRLEQKILTISRKILFLNHENLSKYL